MAMRSLIMANCGVLDHNTKTCHKHLPPKEKKTINKKRKLNSGEGSSSQTQKAKEIANNQKKKMYAMRATRALGTKSAPTSSRPQQPTSTPTSMKGATPTRSSQRIRQNSKAVGK
ncbi:hypothetical protein M0R45_002213 [Rubus argutus]|uniref:Uncharacterized protein n=1 Tax=Rubus argutus TaxID=59490 RepID=A0AAW1VSF0_RUBAR